VAYAAQVIIAFSRGNDSDLISKSIAALKEKAKSRLPRDKGDDEVRQTRLEKAAEIGDREHVQGDAGAKS